MKRMTKFLALAAMAVAAAGCTTIDYKEDHKTQGKVWRTDVYGPMHVLTNVVDTPGGPSEVERRTGVTKEILQGLRFAKFRFRSGDMLGTNIFGQAAVPDSIPSEDVQKGAIVDVLLERGTQLNFPTMRVTRVVRLVCKADDAPCIAKVKKEGTLYTVVEQNPQDGAMYGQTYNSRISMDAYKAYLSTAKK